MLVRHINHNGVIVASQLELDKLEGIISLDFLDFVRHNYITASCIEATLTASQLHWTGLIIHMNDSRFPKAVFYGELAKRKCLHGGQWLRYKDVVKRHLKATHIADITKILTRSQSLPWLS